LTEVEVQREVLWVKEKQIRGRGVSPAWQPPLRRGGGQVSTCRRQKTLSVVKLIYGVLSLFFGYVPGNRSELSTGLNYHGLDSNQEPHVF
jgi:hypothetical protein